MSESNAIDAIDPRRRARRATWEADRSGEGAAALGDHDGYSEVRRRAPLEPLRSGLKPLPAVARHSLFRGSEGVRRRDFDEIDDHYRPRIRRLARSMKLSDADADDVVQDTLLELLCSGGRASRRTLDQRLREACVRIARAHVRAESRRARLYALEIACA